MATANVRAYVVHRRRQGVIAAKGERAGERIGDVSNAQLNRELTALKRAFTLALQAGKLLQRPHIPMLEERNTRTGFFEPEQFTAVLRHLPAALRPVIQFAFITGWRIDSEVLPLEWRQVDFTAGEVRLDPETTKNRDGRVFPMTAELRALLDVQQAARDELRRTRGLVVPWVFFRLVAKGRRGERFPKPIVTFGKAWKTACRLAGCPGRIPHDLRRTAVRNMVRRGVPERVAMQLTGHRTPSVFARYNIVSPADLTEAARRLEGLTAAAGTEKGQSGTLSPHDESTGAQNRRKFGGAARI